MRVQKIKQLEAWDKQYIWHPFTQMKEWCEGDITIIDQGKGNYLTDIRGRRYIDGVSSLWCNVHGHRVKAIDAAIKKQLGKIAHSTFLGLSNTPAVELSKKIIDVAPAGLTKVFYSDSGSASVEVALKMAYQYWRAKGNRKKNTFLKLKNAYHGDTLGAVSVGGIDLFHEIFNPLLFKTVCAESPYFYRDNFNGSEKAYARHCANKVEALLKKEHARICALIVEPVMQGAAGMLKQPKGYLAQLGRLAKKYDVLLILDEVATGFGRTGKMFACEHEHVRPDMLCLAKGITGGYLALSATLTTDKIYNVFLGEYRDFKAFFHGHTYSANPLACAAAIANLEIFEKNKTLQKLETKIKVLSRELWKMKRLRHVGDIRQAGFMAGIELVKDKDTKAPFPLDEKRGFRVCAMAREKGVMLRPLGNVIVIMPPLSITHSELRKIGHVVYDCIAEVTKA